MFVLFALVGILNQIAYHYDLYWTVWEFDSLVHFLAGTALGALSLLLYFFTELFKPKKRNLIEFLKISILGLVAVALMWEIYELVIGEAVMLGPKYPFDTVLDLIMGVLGATVMCFYAYIKELKRFKLENYKVEEKYE